MHNIGDDITLMLDPNARYSLDEAIEVGRILDQTRFRWFEDPLPMGEIEGNLTLAKAIDTPVAISDALTFTPRQMQFFAHRGFDTLRGSSRWLGVTGLREACRIVGVESRQLRNRSGRQPQHEHGKLACDALGHQLRLLRTLADRQHTNSTY